MQFIGVKFTHLSSSQKWEKFIPQKFSLLSPVSLASLMNVHLQISQTPFNEWQGKLYVSQNQKLPRSPKAKHGQTAPRVSYLCIQYKDLWCSPQDSIVQGCGRLCHHWGGISLTQSTAAGHGDSFLQRIRRVPLILPWDLSPRAIT